MPQLPPELPEEAKHHYLEFLSQPLSTRESLKEKVEEQLELVQHHSQQHRLMDVATADCVGHGLLDLIKGAPDELLPHVQAAISYFASEIDVTSDFEPVIGFDDDARVFNAVCSHLDRQDLIVPVDAVV